jgi:hypothetical protein
VHANDLLGGVLSTAQTIERDRIAFSAARSSGTPIAWNLAGGYQEPLERVIELHVNTMRECVSAFWRPS